MRNSRKLILALVAVAVIVGSTITVSLVMATGSFSMSASPSVLTLPTSGSGVSTITVTSIGGFSGTVTITTSSAPPGLISTCTPTSVVVPANGAATATCSFLCSSTPATYLVTVTGISGTLTSSTTISVTCQSPPPTPQFTYTMKWICNVKAPGLVFTPAAAEDIGLVPGEYKTDINVHNPSLTMTFTLKKVFVVSIPEQATVNVGQTAPTTTILGPNAAFFADCKEILGLLGLPLNKAVKGFMTITTSTPDLNVVSEYSSETFDPSGTVGLGISLEVLSIPSVPMVP